MPSDAVVNSRPGARRFSPLFLVFSQYISSEQRLRATKESRRKHKNSIKGISDLGVAAGEYISDLESGGTAPRQLAQPGRWGIWWVENKLFPRDLSK